MNAWQRQCNNQHSLVNPISQSAAVVPDSITGSLKLRTDGDRQREQCIEVVRSDEIYVGQVREQLHYRNRPLNQMKNDLKKTFWNFSMQLCDLHVERASDFPALEAVETFAEFRNYSSAVGRVSSGLRMGLLGLSTHSDDLIRHYHGLAG
jgi:hypothetical protein